MILHTFIGRLGLALLLIGSLLPALAAAEPPEQRPLRLGVLSLAPPAQTHTDWQPFADYLGDRLGRRISIVVPRGFEAMRDAIKAGELDFFYINGHIHYRLKQSGHSVAVLQMINLEGRNVSQSHIFVRADSGIRTVADLENRRIAYVSPMGAGSYLAPRSYLYEQGIESGVETEEFFTRNHPNSVYGVLLGDYDAAALCRLRYQLLSEKIDMGDLAVVGVSFEYAEHVIAVRPDLDPGIVSALREAGIGMINDAQGRAILAAMRPLKIQSFAAYDPGVEELTRRQLEIMQGGEAE